MRLIAYIRVSSTGQLDAYGPDVQLDGIRAWATAARHTIVTVLTDDITGSAGASDRPALLEALSLLRGAGAADGIVVANLTRLARELHVQEAILGQVWSDGGKVFAADQGEILRDDPDDPMRTAMRQMQGVFAQLDRAMTTKRLRDGRRIKAASGRHAGGTYPYGSQGVGEGRERDAGIREDEQAAIARVVVLRGAGASYRAIAAALDSEGLAPRRASSWSAMAVRNVAIRAGQR